MEWGEQIRGLYWDSELGCHRCCKCEAVIDRGREMEGNMAIDIERELTRVCKKCEFLPSGEGFGPIKEHSVTYYPAVKKTRLVPEWMEFKCRRCGYAWRLDL